MPTRPSVRRKPLDPAVSADRRCKCRRVLRSLESEVEELREQNRLLNESARFFAELSERLNMQVRRQKDQTRCEEVVAQAALGAPQQRRRIPAYPHDAQSKP